MQQRQHQKLESDPRGSLASCNGALLTKKTTPEFSRRILTPKKPTTTDALWFGFALCMTVSNVIHCALYNNKNSDKDNALRISSVAITALLIVLSTVVAVFMSQERDEKTSTNNSLWRRNTPSGRVMVVSLIPTLFHSVAVATTTTRPNTTTTTTTASLFLTMAVAFLASFWRIFGLEDLTSRQGRLGQQGIWISVAVLPIGLYQLLGSSDRGNMTLLVFALSYVWLFGKLYRTIVGNNNNSQIKTPADFSSHYQVWTVGEWTVVVSVLTTLLLWHLWQEINDALASNTADSSNHHEYDQDHSLVYVVARSGFLGALAICPIANRLFPSSAHSKVTQNNQQQKQQQDIDTTTTTKTIFIWKRVAFSIIGILLFVELHFQWRAWKPVALNEATTTTDPWLSMLHGIIVHPAAPKCLLWLIQFLMQPEMALWGAAAASGNDDNIDTNVTLWPRYYWLGYWALVLAVTLYWLPLLLDKALKEEKRGKKSVPNNDVNGTKHIPVTLKRKWFHLVAILVFAPVTVHSPQMQALSYAIALSILCLTEGLHVRQYVPSIHAYFSTFLDPDKNENETHNPTQTNGRKSSSANDKNHKTIVSHMGLILGCAMPLYLALFLLGCSIKRDEVAEHHSKLSSVYLNISMLGIVGLGVGDALAAVAGTLYSQWQRGQEKGLTIKPSRNLLDMTSLLSSWGRGNRTGVGSLAMFVSMYTTVLLFKRIRQTEQQLEILSDDTNWWQSLMWMTLVEAYTSQLDNLVLPLVGMASFVCSNLMLLQDG